MKWKVIDDYQDFSDAERIMNGMADEDYVYHSTMLCKGKVAMIFYRLDSGESFIVPPSGSVPNFANVDMNMFPPVPRDDSLTN